MTKKDITFQDKLNELRLDISHPNSKEHTFVLVEGDSDIRLFRKFFLSDKCNVEHIPGGKVKLAEGVSILVEIHPLLIGIQDADFDHLQAVKAVAPNIFLTDYHDIEITMLAQPEVLNALLFEYTNLPADQHTTFRNQVLQSIEAISYLKWLNREENLEFSFEVGFQDLISIKKQAVDFPQYVSRVLSKSKQAKLTDLSKIQQKTQRLKEQKPDLLQLTNGHDLLRTFAIYFRKKYAQKSIDDKILASSIRMTFTFEHFKSTELYKQTNDWARKNEVEIYQNAPA